MSEPQLATSVTQCRKSFAPILAEEWYRFNHCLVLAGAWSRRNCMSNVLTCSGCSCCTQCPAPSNKWKPTIRVHALFRILPSMFVGGRSDWGVYQTPGAVDKMRNSACTRMVGFHLLDGAGHWVQQEQPEQVSTLLIQFLRDHAPASTKQ